MNKERLDKYDRHTLQKVGTRKVRLFWIGLIPPVKSIMTCVKK